MQDKPSREAVEHFIKVGAHLRGRPNLPNAVDNLLLALIARAEAAENALFTLRNRAGCGPDQSGPDVWQQRDAARAERDAAREALEPFAHRAEEAIALVGKDAEPIDLLVKAIGGTNWTMFDNARAALGAASAGEAPK